MDNNKPEARSLVRREEPSLAHMMQVMVDKGITEQNAKALEAMLQLKERMEDRQAERDFNAAFVALQADIPIITATSVIPNRGKYERFEDLMKILKPLLTKHGFSVSFSMSVDTNRIKETCHLAHIAGHKQSNSFEVRTGGKSDSETQADCKAATTAKRLALCNALNIVIQQDVDFEDSENNAALEGAPITLEQAGDIMDRLKALPRPVVKGKEVPWSIVEKKFLEWAGAPSYLTITTGRLPGILEYLKNCEADAKVPY